MKIWDNIYIDDEGLAFVANTNDLGRVIDMSRITEKMIVEASDRTRPRLAHARREVEANSAVLHARIQHFVSRGMDTKTLNDDAIAINASKQLKMHLKRIPILERRIRPHNIEYNCSHCKTSYTIDTSDITDEQIDAAMAAPIAGFRPE